MTTPKKEEGPRSFAVFLGQIDDGCFLAELGEELQAIVKTVSEQAAAKCGTSSGEITIKVKLKIDEKGHAEIKPELKVNLPRPLRPVTRLWVTPGNNLSGENFRQPRLPFTTVEGGGAGAGNEKARDVGAAPVAKV